MRRGVTAMCAAVLAAGCEQPRTELVVRVESELTWGPGQRVQSVVLTVRRSGATGPLRSARTTALGTGIGTGSERLPLPLFVGVTAGDDVTTPVWIEALGCGDPNGCTAATAVVVQRAVVRFTSGQTEEVPLFLASSCAGVACASDQRCTTGGVCEAASRAQAMVVPFTGNALPIGDDAAADARAAADVLDVPGEEDAATHDVAGDQGIAPTSDVSTDLPMDVGVDSGPEGDAIVADATTIDNGADAGVRDVMMDDAAIRTDASVALDLDAADGGLADTGVIDVGSIEAGRIDSGTVDAGVTDGGTTDAGPSLVCAAVAGNRTCHGSGGLAPCCIPILISTSCGCQMPLFGCLPCP